MEKKITLMDRLSGDSLGQFWSLMKARVTVTRT